MTVRLAAIFILVLAATPVAAQTPATPDDTEPRLYQADTPIAINAPAGQTRTVLTDPLGQVRKIAISLSFTCAETTCSDSDYALTVKGQDGQEAVFDVTGQGGKLLGRAGDQPLVGTPMPGETYEVRISWNNGNRITFDLYRHDAGGRDRMESHDVQLSSPVETLGMRVTGGELQVQKQAYTFR